MLLQVAIGVVVAYGGIVGVMYLAQRSLMYVPDVARASPPLRPACRRLRR